MIEKREIIAHAREPLHGPHLALPAGFVPLTLRHEEERITIEVICPAVVVGRGSHADLRLAYPEVSRRHGRFLFDAGQWRVSDLKSLNGIYVNDVLAAEATLYAGDTLRIGSVTLLVLSATPVRVTKADDKLRQIVDVLPD